MGFLWVSCCLAVAMACLPDAGVRPSAFILAPRGEAKLRLGPGPSEFKRWPQTKVWWGPTSKRSPDFHSKVDAIYGWCLNKQKNKKRRCWRFQNGKWIRNPDRFSFEPNPKGGSSMSGKPKCHCEAEKKKTRPRHPSIY